MSAIVQKRFFFTYSHILQYHKCIASSCLSATSPSEDSFRVGVQQAVQLVALQDLLHLLLPHFVATGVDVDAACFCRWSLVNHLSSRSVSGSRQSAVPTNARLESVEVFGGSSHPCTFQPCCCNTQPVTCWDGRSVTEPARLIIGQGCRVARPERLKSCLATKGRMR